MNITDIKGTVALHNGVEMPYLGLGVYKSADGKEVEQAIQWAVETGYRHIDTASVYNNEKGVGNAVRKCGVPRSELFVTTKVWNPDQGFQSTLAAFEASRKRLQLDYIDLYLVHWPVASMYVDTWKALEQLYDEGKVRAIGVSNFMQHHLEELMAKTSVKPMVNQMEFHPYLVQPSLVEYCRARNIVYEAWRPIMRGEVNDIALLQELGGKYEKSPVQVTLRWNLQKGVATIPKSVSKQRIQENGDLFDFTLTAEEVRAIDDLDQERRLGPDPDNFEF